MTQINRPRPHTTTSGHVGRRSSRTQMRAQRRPSIQLISEGVVAGYLHDISDRHHNGGSREGHGFRPSEDRPAA
jgi:hypothetical protein